MVHIASDVPLPLIPWSEAQPAFNVAEVPEQRAKGAKQFSKPYVYEVGSHTGCGCGFENAEDKHGVKFDLDPKEVADGRESRRQLASYLRAALAHQDSIELFAAWADDEERKPERFGAITPEDLIDRHTYFLGDQNFEPEFLIIRSSLEDRP